MFSGKSSLSTTPLRNRSHSGNKPFGLRLNEHLAAIQIHLGIHPAHAHRFKIARRHEQQRLDGQRRVRREMQTEQRLVVVVADERVKLVVFLLLDLVFVPRPDRLHGVQPLGVQFNRERHKARIALDDALDGAFLREILRVVLEFQRDFGAARQIGGRRESRSRPCLRSSIASLCSSGANERLKTVTFFATMNAE